MFVLKKERSGGEIREVYDRNVKKKGNVFGSSNRTDLSHLHFFFNWREYIFKQYEGLYKKQRPINDPEGRFTKKLKEKKLDDRYKWLDFVYILMDKMREPEDKIYEKNYISCLNWLSYFKNKEDIKDKNSL